MGERREVRLLQEVIGVLTVARQAQGGAIERVRERQLPALEVPRSRGRRLFCRQKCHGTHRLDESNTHAGFFRLFRHGKKGRPRSPGAANSLTGNDLLAVDDERDDEGVNDERLDQDEAEEGLSSDLADGSGVARDSLAGRNGRPALGDRAGRGGQADRERAEKCPIRRRRSGGLDGFLGEGEAGGQGERPEGARG